MDRFSQTPDVLTGVEAARLDYAWKYFAFHAEQRTKMFNFMLVGMGIFATAVVTAVDKRLDLEAALLCSVASLVAVVFCFLDHRNRQLYMPALDVLKHAESSVLFGFLRSVDLPDAKGSSRKIPFGIASRTAASDGTSEPVTFREHWEGMQKGQHRYWMPAIGLGFAALFAVAAMRLWLVYFDMTPRWWVIGVGSLTTIGSAAALRRFRGNPLAFAGAALGLALMSLGYIHSGLREPIRHRADFSVAWEADPGGRLQIRHRAMSSSTSAGVIAVANVGPFESGQASLDCSAKLVVDVIKDLRVTTESAKKLGQRLMMILVGSTDREAMSPALRQRYGSDSGLAAARADAVKRCLTQADPGLVPDENLSVVTGPTFTPISPSSARGEAQDALAMAQDRGVRVLLLGITATR